MKRIISIVFISLAIFSCTQKEETKIDPTLIDKIEYEKNIAKAALTEFVQENEILWQSFIDPPQTSVENNNNIKIITNAIVLYQKKDSVTLTAYNNIYSILTNAEKVNHKVKTDFPIKSELIKSIIDAYKLYSEKTTQKLIAQRSVSIAVSQKLNNVKDFYQNYLESVKELEESTQQLNVLAAQLPEL